MPSTRPRASLRGRGPVDVEVASADPRRRWWNEDAAKPCTVSAVGMRVHQELAAIERSQLRQRFMHYVSALLMDGRAPASFGYSMSAHASREHIAMSTAMFRPPSLNCIASIGDTLKERVWSRVSWLEWLPVRRSDYEMKRRCQATNEWMDSFAKETAFEELISMCGHDAATYGTSFVKTMPSRDGTKVVNTRVMVDEMRVSTDAAFGPPKHAGQVSFEDREDLINVYAKGKDADAIRNHILLAPSAFRGFMTMDVNYSDIVALSEVFKYDLPDGTPGRHVLTLADGFTFVDEEWHDDPYSVLRYNKLARSYTGKGVPENCLALQTELDRVMACRAEIQRAASYPRPQSDREAHVDDNEIEGMGIIHYTKTPVRFDVVSGTPKDLDAAVDSLERKIFMREGISQATAGGDMPTGVDAGVAIEAFQKIADGRLYSHAKGLETFIEDIGTRIVKCALIVKPKVLVGGKQVSWGSVAADIKKSKMRAFPMSRLPSSLTGQLSEIERWAQSGQIDQAQRARLLRLPDPTGQLPLIVASESATLFQLGRIVSSGEYEPPDAKADPQKTIDIARAFYLSAFADRMDEDRLLLLLKFLGAAEKRAPAAPAAPMAPGGPQAAAPMGVQAGPA